MDPKSDEGVDDFGNGIENIGLIDDTVCASVKTKTMTNRADNTTPDSIPLQNGDHSLETIKFNSNSKNISNGSVCKCDEEVVNHFDDSSKHSVNNDFNDSEAVVMTEEVGSIEVISEEQVVDENSTEGLESTKHKTHGNSICDENLCDLEVSETINSESVANVSVNQSTLPSIDIDGENSSLSESSSQLSQSSATQPTPLSNSAAVSANSAANALHTFTAATNASANNPNPTSHNESTNISSNSGLHKKKFGKFRILNDESMGTEDNGFCEPIGHHSDDTCLDSKFEKIVLIETTSTQSESSLHENSEHSSAASPVGNSTSNKQTKRRGRPAGSTKKERNSVQTTAQLLLDEEDLSRRRSSRLKTLEARKEQEKAFFSRHRDIDETSGDSSLVNNSDANESQNSMNESLIQTKQKKKKSKKDKNKDKESESKKGKRKKKLSSNNDNSFDDQKSESKFKPIDYHKNQSNIECFTPPLPPSYYMNIRSNPLTTPTKSTIENDENSPKPEKVKSRWRRNSELESGHGFNPNAQIVPIVIPKETEPPPPFDAIDDNIYLFERRKSKTKKESRRMVCDCILTKEERARGLIGCGDDCLNRMLMIECGSRCALGDHCANKRFQKKHSAKVEPFRTAKKGWGLRTLEPLPSNTFIMEYIGEVIDPLDFHNRTQRYSKEKREHHYFMALKSDEIIDATIKGNITRFVNHSCDPNSETQKWTVNGDLRIGFFTQRFVQAGEEITFDYQFQRYGKEAQKCYCDSMNCRGYIGAESASILTDGSKITETNKLEIDETAEDEEILEDLATKNAFNAVCDAYKDRHLYHSFVRQLEEEIAKLAESGGLRNRQQVLMLARLMVRAEDVVSRMKLIDIIKGTVEIAYLRLLLDYHGLQLIWSWMVEVEDSDLKAGILELLEILPIPNKTMLTDSKVYSVVERWSQQIEEERVKPTALPITLSSTENNLNSADIVVKVEEIPIIEQTVKVEESVKPESTVCDSNQPMDAIPLETQPSDAIPLEAQASDVIPLETQPLDSIPLETEPSDAIPLETEPSDAIPLETQPSDAIPLETKPIDEQPTEEKTESLDEICSSTQTEETNEAKDISKTENESQVRDESKEVVDNSSNKSSPRIELKSSSLSLVIKSRSLSTASKTETLQTPTPPVVKSKPSIASLAQKLLINWKELKEVFRIPRLERQKRHEDEKEADRRTKEVEERRARGLPVSYDKRGIDDRDYTIAGILGIKKKGIKRQNDSKDMSNKKSSNPLTQIPASNWKVSKEEHRKMFEREVQQKDYMEALKRYHQQLAYYNAVYGQQYQQQQQLYSQDSTLPQQYSNSYTTYEQYYQNDGNYYQTSNGYSMTTESTSDEYMSAGIQESVEYIDDGMVDESVIFCAETTPPLIPLANFDCQTIPESESTLLIDNVPHDCVVYSDCLDSKTDKEEHKSLFDSTYPPPGVFYLTPDGKSYFTPLPVDGKGKAVNIVIENDITVPLESNFTKSMTTSKLPHNWRHGFDKNGNIYYYHKTKRRTQWFPPEEEIVVSPVIETPVEVVSNDHIMIEDEDSTSMAEILSQHSPKADDNDDQIESTAPDSLSLTGDVDIVINSTESPQNLLKSILALEADPRKRRHLLNSVMPSTTTAAADTSSSSHRKKSISSTRKIQESFRNKMSEYVVHCLNPYRRPDCKKGRIANNSDFKYLARKLTHTIMEKEIKQCKSLEHLSCNDAVKHKTKDYVKKYMARFGTSYKTDNNADKDIAANDSND